MSLAGCAVTVGSGGGVNGGKEGKGSVELTSLMRSMVAVGWGGFNEDGKSKSGKGTRDDNDGERGSWDGMCRMVWRWKLDV